MNIRIYAFLLLLGLCFSCVEKTDGIVNEGSIEYEISYLENNLDNIATNLLPKKMTLSFNERYCRTEIEGFMGVFSINLISDLKKQKDITAVKFFDSKYVHYGEKNEHSCVFEHVKIDELTFAESDKKIIGYNVAAAKVLEKGKTTPYDVFFTKDIVAINPNENNPFSDIDGVLLHFELQLNQLRMSLDASKINTKELDEDIFSVSEEYKVVSKENMCLLLNKILETN